MVLMLNYLGFALLHITSHHQLIERTLIYFHLFLESYIIKRKFQNFPKKIGVNWKKKCYFLTKITNSSLG
jgi:hypothetical protein